MATIGKMLTEREQLESVIEKQRKEKQDGKGRDRGGGKPSGASD